MGTGAILSLLAGGRVQRLSADHESSGCGGGVGGAS
jgi:hypothetical protein